MRRERQTIGGLGNKMFLKAYVIGQLLDGNVPDQYLQSSQYWKGHEKQIKEFFSEGIGSNNMIGLHIRRGDYKKADNFHVDLCKTDYYQRAVQLFPNEKFLVFCADRQDAEDDYADSKWTEGFLDTFIPGRYEMHSSRHHDTEDLNDMASCKALIMANSSFSWWAAELNPNNPTIVCPEKWFVDGQQRTEIQDSWIQL